ncbi:MAG: hypothetical protein ABL895_14575, partial [Cyclobacteriaceae bacterium]
KKIQQKKLKGDSLTVNETAYVKDYDDYLVNYYQRMSEEEKVKYEEMKAQWDQEFASPQPQPSEYDFELRPRDRLTNGIYGLYYGASIAAIAEFDEAAAIGVPLIMAGLWQLGPVLNPKKYEGISSATIRAGNTGKFLGLVYGGALGLALGGDSDNTTKLMLGLSTIGSISLGEAAFQIQKKKPVSEGHIEMMRHYGMLGSGVAVMTVAALNTDNLNLVGTSILAGGVAGLIIGNNVAKKYDYTVGDVDIISSLTWITTGLGFTVAVEAIQDEVNLGLLLIPTGTAIAGTIWGQRSVKGVYLTKKQGSTINLASGGAALIGLGIVALIGADSPGVLIGVPSAMALIMHQTVFHSYKMKNLEGKIKLGSAGKRPVQFSMRVTPESYFTNKKMSDRLYVTNNFPKLADPIIKLKLTF